MSEKKRGGRPKGTPVKLTPQREEALLKAISSGNFIGVACEYVGINHSTYARWMQWGEGGQEPYASFREKVLRAKASAEFNSVLAIRKAANEGQWQAAAWYLERSRPERWSRVQRNEITGAEGGALEVKVTRDELESKLIALLRDDDNI